MCAYGVCPGGHPHTSNTLSHKTYLKTTQVKDHDLVGKHDDLGDYSLRIDDLPPLKPVDLELALCHTTQARVVSSFLPLVCGFTYMCSIVVGCHDRDACCPSTQRIHHLTRASTLAGLPLRAAALPPRAAPDDRAGGRWCVHIVWRTHTHVCVYVCACVGCTSRTHPHQINRPPTLNHVNTKRPLASRLYPHTRTK